MGEVGDDARIRATLPTLRYLLERNAGLVLLSHLGRPKGKWAEDQSLRPWRSGWGSWWRCRCGSWRISWGARPGTPWPD
jgi:3-phosphoglycerate kinase